MLVINAQEQYSLVDIHKNSSLEHNWRGDYTIRFQSYGVAGSLRPM